MLAFFALLSFVVSIHGRKLSQRSDREHHFDALSDYYGDYYGDYYSQHLNEMYLSRLLREYYMNEMDDRDSMLMTNYNFDIWTTPGRPASPYVANPFYNFALGAVVGVGGIQMDKHHIIDWNTLKSFWNAAMTHNKKLGLKPIIDSIKLSMRWNDAAIC